MTTDDVPDRVYLRGRLDDLERAILSHAWPIGDEDGVHARLLDILTGGDWIEEFRLDEKSRPDFFHAGDGIVVEVKVAGSPSAVLAQLVRYADHPKVRAVVLVTNLARLSAFMPAELRRKPIRIVKLWRCAI